MAVGLLSVDPAGLSGAGVSVGAVGDGLTAATTALTATFNANTGQDAAGVQFGRQYVNTGGDLLKAATAGVNACRNTGYGIQVTAANYSRAEAASDVSGRSQPLPTPPCPAPASASSPPTVTGGGVAEPALWAAAEFLVGDLWPNGDPVAMRIAAASWRTFSTTLDQVSGDMSGGYNVVGAQQMPEGELIKASLRDIGTLLSSAAGACQTLADGVEAFAADVEQTQHAIRNLLNKLGSIGGRTVLGHVKTEADAKTALVEAAKQNVDGWALSLERFADRTFVDFFGEDVGRVLGAGFNSFVDAREGDFRWAVGMAQGIVAMNPLRFAYDPEGASQTWKSLSETAALANPSMIPALVASDPEGVKDTLKGLARVDEFDPNRPMVSVEQNALDIVSLGIPGVGEAGAGADAASAAARAVRAGEVADEAGGVARAAGGVTRVTNALGDVSERTAGVTGKLDDIARKPVPAEAPAGGRPVPPTQPIEPPSPPVAKQSAAPCELVPLNSIPSEAPSATTATGPRGPQPPEQFPATSPAEVKSSTAAVPLPATPSPSAPALSPTAPAEATHPPAHQGGHSATTEQGTGDHSEPPPHRGRRAACSPTDRCPFASRVRSVVVARHVSRQCPCVDTGRLGSSTSKAWRGRHLRRSCAQWPSDPNHGRLSGRKPTR
ncbi:outer membrane channel protein/necrotizing toxin glycohydrolase CpnT [soil metagenome]